MNRDHLSQDLIILLLDDELAASQRLECELHVEACESCRQKLTYWHELSVGIETAVQLVAVPDMAGVRQNLERTIESRSLLQNGPLPVLQHPAKVMQRFGWGMAIAATLAFGVLMAPRQSLGPLSKNDLVSADVATGGAQTATIEVDGETFYSLPYSNADLSPSALHIVQMQVPIASLADVGIVLEPVMSRAGADQDAEGSVLADVLVGADGQPRGVHVPGLE